MPTDCRKSIALWKVPRLGPFVLVRATCRRRWVWSTVSFPVYRRFIPVINMSIELYLKFSSYRAENTFRLRYKVSQSVLYREITTTTTIIIIIIINNNNNNNNNKRLPIFTLWRKVHSFSILSDDRSKASSKTMPPYSAIQSLLLQMRMSSPVLKVIQ